MKRRLLTSILLLASVGSVYGAEQARLAEIAGDGFDPGAAPGCAVAVYRNGKTESFAGSGYANVERQARLDGDTLFYAASVSKQFTALAIATLVEQKRLALDDEVRKYIPELPAYEQPVTVAMLLHHASGIRDSLGLLGLAGYESSSQVRMEKAVELVLAQKNTNFTPGTETGYTNGGYLLLAEIVARVSGERFANYVKHAVLEPMGMTSSFVLDDSDPVSPHLANGYVNTVDMYVVRNTYPRFGGSGGLMLSLNDLARYEYDIEHGHKVWTPAVRAIMTKPGVLSNGKPAADEDDVPEDQRLVYAAGLQVGKHLGYDVVQHGGGAEGFNHLYTRIPSRKLGIAVFCNRDDGDSGTKMDAAIEAVLGAAPGYTPPPFAVGRYRSEELDTQYQIDRVGDALRVEIVPGAAAQASQSGQTTSARPAHERVILHHEDDGSFKGDGVTLQAAKDGGDLILESGRIKRLRLQRVSAATQ